MESKKDLFIAYTNLKKKIIDQGFCTACGACVMACPVEAMQIVDGTANRLHNCTKDLDLCPICYSVCPHSSPLILRSLKTVSNAPIKNEAIGYYRRMLLAQAADPNLRKHCEGSGVITALLTYGVERKIFDSAIVSQAENQDPTKPNPIVAEVPDDILSAVGSRFFPSSVVKAYGTAIKNYGKTKIAVVGIPCHVLALRKLAAMKHKNSRNLTMIFGLFCFGTFSLKPLHDYLEKTYNVKPTEIKEIKLTKNLVIKTEKESIIIPFEELQDKFLTSCKTCADFTSEFSDVSVGRAFPLTDWSVIIVRTQIGDSFISEAIRAGVINTRDIEQEPKVFERVIKPAIRKRTEALRAANKIEGSHGFIPARLLSDTELLARVKVEEIMTRDVRTVSFNTTVSELLELMATEHHVGYPVKDDKDELVGIVTMEEASVVDKDKRDQTLVGTIARLNLDVVYPGETAQDAFRKMSKQETGRVLVLDPENPQKLIGIITKADLLHALVKQV